MKGDKVSLFGFACNSSSLLEAADHAEAAINEGGSERILFLNAAKVASPNSEYVPILNSVERLYADGQSIVIASRCIGPRLPERVAGVDLMYELLKRANVHGWSVFFLGSTDDVLRDVQSTMEQSFPNARVVGVMNGYFDAGLDPVVAESIRVTHPDLLFVAMPSPRKEQWVAEMSKATGAHVSMGIGGSLEVLTGRVARAPVIVQRMGMEWGWRVYQEPRRLWRRYATSNFRFLVMTIRETIRARNAS